MVTVVLGALWLIHTTILMEVWLNCQLFRAWIHINFLSIGRTNFASFRPATQSSMLGDWKAGRAVDSDLVIATSSTDKGDLQPW